MFDEGVYNTALGAMDHNFRRGRYSVVQGSPQYSHLDEYYNNSQTIGHRPNPYLSSHQHNPTSSLPRHMTERKPMYASTGRLNVPPSHSYANTRSGSTNPVTLNRNPPSYSNAPPNKYHSTSNLLFDDSSNQGTSGFRSATPPKNAADNFRSNYNYATHRNGAETTRRGTGSSRDEFGTSARPDPKRVVIFDGSSRAERRTNSRNGSGTENAFLGEIQRELEHQRRNLSGEVDKLLLPMNEINLNQASCVDTDKTSFVDMSSGKAVFKAFVDVSDYPQDSVKIRLDAISKKIVVEAGHVSSNNGSLSNTFTQKITLPRYADETKMDAKLNSKGIVKIEIPLLFYFPDDENKSSVDRRSKAFVNGVSLNQDGMNEVEIVVKIGNEINPSDLRVEVLRDKLTVFVERGDQRRIINTYLLPIGADVGGITSHRQDDDYLVVRVPVAK